MSFFGNGTNATAGGSKAEQREKAKQFISFTNASEKSAQKYLRDNIAVNSYFATDGAKSARPGSNVDPRRLAALFDKYKDPEEDAILLEGTEELCGDLNIDPTDVVTLVLAWHLQCPHMCEFRRAGWLSGWTSLGYAKQHLRPTAARSTYDGNVTSDVIADAIRLSPCGKVWRPCGPNWKIRVHSRTCISSHLPSREGRDRRV
ncbi:uncharacterized protein EV422DRAFT_405415 [Fimicolochytrium jonesii]|uniref:uncharacterized protein n=1 Tax=Fimicolochytrium jonesii TaxID=1396493 RepID=UPI0022FF0CCB|nr:uncharacterized protein EV422DRAFT_405415 [Fimicolochytrium jonesii]KAI8822592.1 hypothetical protein EV422DRAFT_405415 [Fimicolochytrium jonesii]